MNQDSDKLLSLAVRRDRPEILALLLELGLDPDERHRSSEGDEVAFSAGEPLWYCAYSGRYAMAQTLLEHGADSNANVEASGTPVFIAYGQSDRKMVALLEQHGGGWQTPMSRAISAKPISRSGYWLRPPTNE